MAIQHDLANWAADDGLPPDLILAVAYNESGWNPSAQGDGGHSVGLFQPHDAGHGAGMGDDRYDPFQNYSRMREDFKYWFEALGGAQAYVADPLGFYINFHFKTERPAEPPS